MKLTSIYCINRLQDADRRKSIEFQAECLGIEIQILEAVEGSRLTEGDYIKGGYNVEARRKYYSDMHQNEVACALSHKKALELFLETEDEYCIVIEDDADLSENFCTDIKSLIAKVKGWDLVKLECRAKKVKGFAFGQPVGDLTLYAGFDAGLGTTGLLYTRLGAEKVMASLSDFVLPIDDHLGYLSGKNLRTVGVLPSIVWENHVTESTIVNRAAFRRVPGFSSLVVTSFQRWNRSLRKKWGALKTRLKVKVNQ